MSTAKSNGVLLNGHKDWRTDPAQFAEVVTQSLQEAAAQAIAEHHRAGDPVAIWRDGQIVMLYPDGSTRPVETSTGTAEE